MTEARWRATPAELVEGVRDGERLGYSGFHFVRAPMAQLAALCDRGIRDLTVIGWGGSLPLELLLSAGAVRKLVFCFSSLDIFGLAPRFRRALETDAIASEEWTALGLISALRAAGEGLSWEVFQAPLGSGLFDGFARRAPDLFPEITAAPMATVARLELDTFLLHAQRADDDGNVEVLGGRGTDQPMAFAAKRVLVTVEERVRNGQLGGTPGGFLLPRSFVTGICVAPLGAYPTSCLPYYGTDYRKLHQVVQAGRDANLTQGVLAADSAGAAAATSVPANPPERILSAFARASARRRAAAPPVSSEPAWTIDELMACCIARTVDDDSICSVGSVSPLPTVGYLLAKRLWAPRMVLMSFNGGLLDIAFRPMSIMAAEWLDFASAAMHTGGDETYHWYYQQGRVTHEVVSAAQIDRHGATNNIGITRPGGGFVRLPGQGGMADVADLHSNFHLYLTRHSPQSLVEAVDVISASRRHLTGQARRSLGLRPGQVTVLTNLGQFELDPAAGELVLTALHPGVTLAELRSQTGFEPRISGDLAVTEAPTADELRALRHDVDPLGIRRLEFVPSAHRGALIDELLTAEEQLLRELAER
jgi:glutaconate CoA-transferase, subunit A